MNEELKNTIVDSVKELVSPLLEKKEVKKEMPVVTAPKLSKKEKLVEFVKFLSARGNGNFGKAENIAKSINLATDGAGAYLAPEEWQKKINKVADDYGVARKLAKRYPMQYTTVNLPKKNAGATAYFVASGANITESSPTFTEATLNANKLATLVSIDNTMLGSAVDINMVNYIVDEMGRAIAYQEDNEGLNGDGSSPAITGIFQDSTISELVMSSGDTSFDDISFDYLVELKSKVPHQLRSYGNGSRWLMSDDIFARIQKLKTTTGAPIYQSLNNSDEVSILGHKVVLSSVAPATDAVSTSFIAFGNFEMAWTMGLHKDMSVDLSKDYNFNSDRLTLRAVELMDFAMVLPTALAKITTAAS